MKNSSRSIFLTYDSTSSFFIAHFISLTQPIKAVEVDGIPGYLTVARLPEEVLALGRKMAERIALNADNSTKNTDNIKDSADDEDDVKPF